MKTNAVLKMLKSISRTFLYLPLLWLAVGIIWLPQGSKPMVAMVLPVVLFYFLTHGVKDIKRNFKSSYWLKGVLASTLFVAISYVYHGASSQELRGLLISLIYLAALPLGFINVKSAQVIIFLAALASFILSLWFFLIEPSRMLWPSNPVPLAIHQGFIYLTSAALLLSSFDNRKTWLLATSMILSGAAILFTASRGPILGVVLLSVLILSVLMYQKRLRLQHSLSILLVVVSLLFFAKEPIASRLSDTVTEMTRMSSGDLNSSIGLRVQMYLAGVDLFIQKPVIGHGEITSAYASEHAPGYTAAAYDYMKGHFHNNFLDKMVKSGVLGLAFLLFLLLYPLYLALIKRKCFFWVLSLLPAYYILMSLFDSPFRNGDTTVLYLIVVGIIIQTVSIEKNSES